LKPKQPFSPEDFKLRVKAKEIFEKSNKTYGSRRIVKALSSEDEYFSRERARRLMEKLNLKVKPRKKYKVTTDSKHNYPVVPNILNREFNVPAANKVWVSDVTYIWTREGCLYLAFVLDLFSRKVVGWSIKDHMATGLVIEVLRMAWWQRKPYKGIIHHSDHGSQHASHEYQRKIKNYGMVCSMSSKGNCWDNTVVERFFGSLKTERVDLRQYDTRQQAVIDIIDYIVMFYNSNRLHSYLGYRSPSEFEVQRWVKAA
jgi:transposase InsO family protein